MSSNKVEERVGEIYPTNNFGNAEIIEYKNNKDFVVSFEDGTIIKCLNFRHLKEGKLKNPNHPSVYSVGYYGIGIYNFSSSKEVYTKWVDMIRRGHSQAFKNKYPSYKDVIVCEEWHNFQNFAKWFEENWKEYMQGWHLDKDILVKGNKIYSPETCCFVPQEINISFISSEKTRGNYPIGVSSPRENAIISKLGNIVLYTGDNISDAFKVYKRTKEQSIKEIADKWKPLITSEVYQAMYNYTVEITD